MWYNNCINYNLVIKKLHKVFYDSDSRIFVVVFGTLIYLFEGDNQNFSNILKGILWSVETILGGSISRYYPSKLAGEITKIAARFTGLVLFGLLINVVGTVVKKIIFGTKKI